MFALLETAGFEAAGSDAEGLLAEEHAARSDTVHSSAPRAWKKAFRFFMPEHSERNRANSRLAPTLH